MIDSSNKITERENLVSQLDELKGQGKSIGFTSGVFDLMHPGHTDYLEKAAAACDILVVGINTDDSVRALKGESRPICSQEDRQRVVAALGCVDFVFLFDEKNNNQNIEILKPNFYIKAGDYDKSSLSSAPIVEKHGGEVLLIPLVHHRSSSEIIKSVLLKGDFAPAYSDSLPRPDKAPAVFIDRDGTINRNVGYLGDPEQFEMLPGAAAALRRFTDMGMRIIIMTNQSGIGLGYYTKQDFFRVNHELLKAAGKAGAKIERVYFCPHSEADGCDCRKPGTALFDRAVRELNVDLTSSFMIGDSTGDILAGTNAGCRTILVETGSGGNDGVFDVSPDRVATDLEAAATWWRVQLSDTLVCQTCQNSFTVEKTEQDFLARMTYSFADQPFAIPHPDNCPACREQLRVAHRNESTLYRRPSTLSQQPVISLYAEQPLADRLPIVYGQDEWWSDSWDGVEYGRDFDFSRPFFEQLAELQRDVPRIALMALKNENSPYTHRNRLL